MKRCSLFVVVAGVLAASAASAQVGLPVPTEGPAAPAARSRVRVHTTSSGDLPIVGTLISNDAETVVVTDEARGATWRIPAADIARIEKTSRTRFGVGRGAGYGLLIGAGLGAAMGAITYSPCRSTGFMSCFMTPASRAQNALWYGAGLGVVGVVVGSIAGLAGSRDTWVDITPTRMTRIVIAPTSNGAAIGVSFGF
jgi:hypothetical protein